MSEVPTMPGESTSAEVIRRTPTMVPATAETMSDDEIRRSWRIASALAASGMFKAEPGKGVTPEQAFAKILIGRDLGIGPTQALMSIDLVRGNVQMRAVLLASFVRKSEDYDYAIGEHTEVACEVQFTYRGREAGLSRYTMEDATKAGLTKPSRNGEPSMYAKHPKNMLWARAMSNGVKWYAPDLLGGIPVYTEADVFEGSAEEVAGLASGHGDGSEPGWGDTSAEAAAAVEAVIERAQALGHVGLSDRATVQMSLAGQDDTTIGMWVERATRELDDFEARQTQGAWATEPDPPTEAPQTEADKEQLQADLDRVLDRIAEEESADVNETVLRDLEAEQERIEGLLGHDEPGEGQETMPL